MLASSNYNANLNRVEISFTRPPGRDTKNALYKYRFEYLPSEKIWVCNGRRENEAGRIVYINQCESEQSKIKINHG